jgi:uncharacterized protein
MRKVAGVVCALLSLALAAWAVDFTALQPEGYISDFARVIDPSGRAALERYCTRVEEVTGAQIAVITLETLAGEPVEDVASAIYRKWGIGKKGSDEGVLLLLATRDRKMRLEVGYGLEPVIPDGAAGGLLRAMRPALRESRYGEAVTEAVRALGARIAESKGKSIDEALPRRTARRSAPGADFWPVLLFGGMLVLWAMGAAGGRGGPRGRRGGGSGTDMLAGMIIGSLLGRSFGGRGGGGGFGGFDSGGGFGGFGGGSSGGGGASSGW